MPTLIFGPLTFSEAGIIPVPNNKISVATQGVNGYRFVAESSSGYITAKTLTTPAERNVYIYAIAITPTGRFVREIRPYTINGTTIRSWQYVPGNANIAFNTVAPLFPDIKPG